MSFTSSVPVSQDRLADAAVTNVQVDFKLERVKITNFYSSLLVHIQCGWGKVVKGKVSIVDVIQRLMGP